MTSITIELPNERLQKFQAMALRLGISIEELARITIEDMLAQPDAQFQKISEYLLTKNSELYKRLAA